MTYFITLGEMRFLKWHTPVNYKNLKFLKAEYKNCLFLHEKLKREKELMGEEQQWETLKTMLDSLMKQLPLAIYEIQQAEELEKRTHDNHQQLIDALNIFKRDLNEEMIKTQSYVEGLIEGNQTRIKALEISNTTLVKDAEKFDARIDTLFKIGGSIGGVISLAIAALALRN
ncbi:hypothetical protein [Roseofilum sp. Belize Diploria]|uniref:hypothetical protein n=1 Tax=Roseofilum sp. Belize Diploria TaxID=2821501 RepID=UPI001B005D67|nr:hypothetical protein [Roseofilum sp. Belize Diploria]MBP0008045.1 hypothetical protein [Roseofilum sp. Belize Diploria]